MPLERVIVFKSFVRIDLGISAFCWSGIYWGRKNIEWPPMLEYAVIAGAMLGSKFDSLFDLSSLAEIAPIFCGGIILAASGYLIKGIGGALGFLFIGLILFLSLKNICHSEENNSGSIFNLKSQNLFNMFNPIRQ